MARSEASSATAMSRHDDDETSSTIDNNRAKKRKFSEEMTDNLPADRRFLNISTLENVSKLQRLSSDANLVDFNVSRKRTRSEFVDNLAPDSSASLPATPNFIKKETRRRNFSQSDVHIQSRRLLGSFTESALNGRLDPVSQLDGFYIQLSANSSTFSSPQTTLPIRVFFFDLNTTGNAFFPSEPVPYLGKCELSSFKNPGYRIPRKGTIQTTLFNPQNTVIKIFVTPYDVEDIPSNSRTFMRHVWEWKVTPKDGILSTTTSSFKTAPHLAHLIHYRLLSDRKRRVHLHTDVRLIFSQNSARNSMISDNSDSNLYQLVDHIDMPDTPKYSSIK